MNHIESTLIENIDKPDSLFIFPTDLAANRWADHVLRLRGGSIAMEQFTAWDKFRDNSIRSKVQEKKSITPVLRKMFVSSLIKENAEKCSVLQRNEGSQPVFTSLIRPLWAEYADSYTGWIAKILPQLGIWYNKIEGYSGPLTGEDHDLYTLRKRYTHFLDQYNLFEPAWETPPFNNEGKKCFIFFSESLFDFNEYRHLLETSDHVYIIETGKNITEEQKPFFYANSRIEITEAALYILSMQKNNNIPWDSISISVPETGNYGPYLLRELENRNIPYINRIGRPLASYPAGRFFTSLAECALKDFSFSSLTTLLLNRHLPWKDSETINNLMDFGIKNNCICSWTEEEDGQKKAINVWEDSFIHPYGAYKPETIDFFKELKKQINTFLHAETFNKIREQYFAFRKQFFNMENVLPETNLVLSRCITELLELCNTEKLYPGVCVPNPFLFFTSHLEEIIYLARPGSFSHEGNDSKEDEGGVTILPYKTAAPAYFDCHIILGASQENLSIDLSSLKFLPKTKRLLIGIAEKDASEEFINLHRFNSRLQAAFFCSEDTFSGYAIPHSSLKAEVKPKHIYSYNTDDFYRSENNFITSLYCPVNNQIELPQLTAIHSNQKQGFNAWLSRRYNTNSDYRAPELKPLIQIISEKFRNDNEFPGKYGVSATSLEVFYKCPLIWFFSRALELKNFSLETGLMADNTTGIVYHAVLNLFFNELMLKGETLQYPLNAGSDKTPVPLLPQTYSRLLYEKTEIVFEYFPRIPGSQKTEMSMLTARMLRAQKKIFFSKLEKMLANFLLFFGDYRILASESQYRIPMDNFYLNGKVDCILEAPDKTAIIIDFKTKSRFKRSDYTRENGQVCFQLPLYLRLAQAALNREVHTALLFGINNDVPDVLFGTIKNVFNGKIKPHFKNDHIIRGSDVFLKIMAETDKKACQFANEIQEGNFSFYPSNPDTCKKCDYGKVCRSLYSVSRGNNYGS